MEKNGCRALYEARAKIVPGGEWFRLAVGCAVEMLDEVIQARGFFTEAGFPRPEFNVRALESGGGEAWLNSSPIQ